MTNPAAIATRLTREYKEQVERLYPDLNPTVRHNMVRAYAAGVLAGLYARIEVKDD